MRQMFPDNKKEYINDCTFYALNEQTGEYEKVGTLKGLHVITYVKPVVTMVKIKLVALLAMIVCTLKGDEQNN